MSSRLIDFDPITKIRNVFHDLGDDRYVIETTQDTNDIVDFTVAQNALVPHKSNKKFSGGDGYMYHVGQIPMVELDNIMRMCGGDEEAVNRAIRQYLNTNPKLKTRPVTL